VTLPDGTRTVPKFAAPTIAQIAVPTTLAGGEFNNQAGCTDLRVQIKHGYRHAELMPRVVVLDPAPSVHAPLMVWISTGLRAVDHAVEGICSQYAHAGGDASFTHALKLLSRGLRAAKREPGDLDARLDCQLGVWLSMAGRQGRAQMGASHALGHVLGGSYEVPQGDASSVVLPHVLRFNRSVNAERQRLVAEAMGCAGEDAADVVAALVADLGLPCCLTDVGIERAQFGAIAAHAMKENWLQSNPRPISDAAQIMEILNAAA
jgi:maleylacetate reductase